MGFRCAAYERPANATGKWQVQFFRGGKSSFHRLYAAAGTAASLRSALTLYPAVGGRPLQVGKEHCPFCLEVRRTFDALGVPFALHNVDVMPDGDKVR